MESPSLVADSAIKRPPHPPRLAGREGLRVDLADALGPDAARLVAGELVFRDPVDQALCAGWWRVTECSKRRRLE
jgi:hypothetical protein